MATHKPLFERSSMQEGAATVRRLSIAGSFEEMMDVITHAVRTFVGADGTTFVRREGDQCHYLEEDAISPLWKGRHTPMSGCISGWCMNEHKSVVIPDIYQDNRIQQDFYRPTFVRSLAIVPVRQDDPMAVIGAYWASSRQIAADEIEQLQSLANIAAMAWDHVELLRERETKVAEIETVMAELRRITAGRQATEQDLRASKDRLQLAFDATQLGGWQYDTLRGVIWGDARFKEFFDVTADEVSYEDLTKRVHPDDVERFLTDRAALLDPANPKPYVHHEYRILRRDGVIRWVEGYAMAYFEGTGTSRRAVSVGGTLQDVTERRDRQEKEQLLMREINHRAKNMLSVVDSIAHQTAARNPEDFVERFSERIQALSANQDLLVRNEWRGVDVGDLVRAQLAHFADLIGSRVVVHGPKLHLNPASAQAIGLALHELATNAGKYGALSTDIARVEIGWGITIGDRFTISWTERDGPPVTAPKRRGFGTTVITALAERGVGGSVDLDYASSGLTWRLTCPARNALESAWRLAIDTDSLTS